MTHAALRIKRAAGTVVVLAVIALAIVTAIVGTHWFMRNKTLEIAIERTPPLLLGTIWAAMAMAVVAEQGKGSAFIYFQF